MRKTIIATLILSAATLSVMASPDRHERAERRQRLQRRHVAEKLDLTEGQRQAFRQIRDRDRGRFEALHDQMRAKARELRDLEIDAPSREAIKAEIRGFREQARELRRAQREEFSKQLTAEQRERLAKLKSRRQERRTEMRSRRQERRWLRRENGF